MSALSHGLKIRFFEFLKGLLRRPVGNGAVRDEPAEAGFESAPLPVANASRSTNHEAAHGGPQNGNGLCLPLQPVLNSLPLELRGRVRQTDVGDLTVSVPLVTVLSQLASGSVKVPFGRVRQAAPNVFTGGPERDQVLVSLPLGEILARLNPALLVRRPAQRQIQVPAEIRSPFDANGQGLVFSVGNVKPEARISPTPRAISPAPATPTVPATPTIPARAPITSTPALPPATAIRMPSTLSFRREPAPLPPPTFQRNPAPTPPAAVPFAPASPPPKPASESARLTVGLTALAESWPEALRQEIVQLNLVDAKVGLPVELVENALKRGRVAFSWKALRSWIWPAPLPTVSAHDAAELELPLKVLAPLFLARQRASASTQQKVTIDAEIPNLFFGFPKPEAPAPAGTAPAGHAAAPATGPVAKPVDTNYYVWDDASEIARVDETEFKRKLASGTDFATRYATPNEIVSRAAALEGVAGALIALPDGLMVASHLSPDLNADTLAAFLPQIFGKVSQCTKELRMGELNNLNFTVGSVPWKIFRVHAIYFAAFGRTGEPLPTRQLAALAAELDRKK